MSATLLILSFEVTGVNPMKVLLLCSNQESFLCHHAACSRLRIMWFHLDHFAIDSVSLAVPILASYLCKVRFNYLADGGVSPAAPRLCLCWHAIFAGCGLTTLPSAKLLRLCFVYTIFLLAISASVQQSNHHNGQRLVAMFFQLHRAQ